MDKFLSNAEKKADKARILPAFNNFNLLGVKKQVADILKLVGRVEEIFSTYTAHDISHIDKMLSMLDWIIPPDTQRNMTSTDWLLTVLAIYLHDLGMLVTKQEYIDRYLNEDFIVFSNDLFSNSENKDYLGRIEKMGDEDKERFLYQEFIRKQHAARIKGWITGKNSTKWGQNLKVMSDAIGDLLRPLPTRFKENLADVCASHGADNLDQPEYFPISQRYGDHLLEIANVQYVAILVRTVDLLHVTSDRTPSIMYKLINISDPLGVVEWEKHKGTFSVYMKSREFDESDPDSHIILISADFSEERPYFALAEYLVYANEQIEQSKRWADKTEASKAGKGYCFPWETVKGDIRVEGNEPVPMRFDLDRGRLLELLVGHTIYNDPTVAVRELLQNAIDAVRFRYYFRQKSNLDQDGREKMGQVIVYWDPNERELTVEDNGIGMSLDIIKFHLMRVGASFYDTPIFHNENKDFSSISRFGIGVLTCFMISDEVEIITCQENQGYRIKMTSVRAEYLLKKLNPGNPILENIEGHGTKVKLKLRSNIDVSARTILDILKYWIIVPECEVLYIEKGQQPIQVGFKNPRDALESFLLNEEEKDFDIIETHQEEGNAIYDLVFAVHKAIYFPERSFVTRSLIGPAVCIEGIRAGEQMPGFVGLSMFSLLSVRGNKRFRTTVSRMNLEEDDEFINVAGRCADILFKFLSDEIHRVASLPGSPLSQASSVGGWLIDRLISGASPFLEEKIYGLNYKLARIVVENISAKTDSDFITERKLISNEDLDNIPVFWTIESRLVDYLGVMSRDLGTELSLNEFLRALAPSFIDKRVSTIIPDAKLFQNELISSHTVVSAEFSRRNIQTKLEWQKNTVITGTTIPKIKIDILQKVASDLNKTGMLSRGSAEPTELLDTIDWFSRHIYIAPIQGDIKDVFIVSTLFCKVINPNCNLANVINNINQARLLSGISDDDLCKLLEGIIIITWKFRALRRYFEEIPVHALWKYYSPGLNQTLKKLNKITFDICSDQFVDIVGSYQNTFDASTYWRDWDQEDRR